MTTALRDTKGGRGAPLWLQATKSRRFRPLYQRRPDAGVDRLMVEEYGIPLMQMMENFSWRLAHLARRRFRGYDPPDCRVLVGEGGNGGGGLVCPYLWSQRAPRHTGIGLCGGFTDVPRHQIRILERLSIPVKVVVQKVELPQGYLITDVLIGYGLHGDPGGPAAALIHATKDHNAPILALDVPSAAQA